MTYSPEVLALLKRVRDGNNKLWKAWLQIRGVKDAEQSKKLWDTWTEKKSFLGDLCAELKVKGYADCLYLDETGKKMVKCLYNPDSYLWFCQVCPAERRYWEEEFDGLPIRAPQGVLDLEKEKPRGG